MQKVCYPPIYKAVNKENNKKVNIPQKRIDRTGKTTILGTGNFGDVILAKKVINRREDGKEYAIKTERGPDYDSTEKHINFYLKTINEVRKANIASDHDIGPKIYESRFCKQEGKLTSIIILEKWGMSLKDFFVKRFARNLADIWDIFKLNKKEFIIKNFSYELLKNPDLPTRRQNIRKIIFRCSNKDTNINTVYKEIQSLIKNALSLSDDVLEILRGKVEKMRDLELFHGDLVPKNILVNVDESKMTITDICITDFGLYRVNRKDNYDYLLRVIQSWFGSRVADEIKRRVRFKKEHTYDDVVENDKYLLDTLLLEVYTYLDEQKTPPTRQFPYFHEFFF